MVDLVAPEVADATVKVLRAGGCVVTVPEGQTCCGQPAWNAGFAPDAARVALTTLAALERGLADGAEWIVVPAGSCATMIRVFWPELFTLVGDTGAAQRAAVVAARTKEFSELVVNLPLPALTLDPCTVAMHQSCHALRELRIEEQPSALADRIDGCRQLEWIGADRCCGFGGLFSVKLPETSVAMADDKLESLAACEQPPDFVVGIDTSCLVHLRSRSEHLGAPIRAKHLAELLADALPRVL
jgi:L-lactate dehydrogenase complex protein LldE